ncbi:Alpha/Beta hydrolase protein [Abortiporus biennis]|nr:Alpha/Beta hydrolase protein [Abortiporus biennis]
MSQYAHLSTPSAELAAALPKLPPSFPPIDVDTMRASYLTGIHMANSLRLKHTTLPTAFADDQVQVKERKIPVEGGEIRVITYVPTPSDSTAYFPLFVWLHGGGWTIGAPEMDDFLLRRVSHELQTSIVSVEYRKSPEFPFPIPINDCYDALKWAVNNASELRASPAQGLILGGCSAGGNMTAALTLRARDDPFFQGEGKSITGQFLQVPCVVHPDVVPEHYKSELHSYEENPNEPVLSVAAIYKFLEFYKPDPLSPLFSPLLAPSHEGLPPAYFQICGKDPLRDESFLYERVLSKNGVKTKYEAYAGYPHAGSHSLVGLEITKKFENDFVDGVRWLLQSSGSN